MVREKTIKKNNIKKPSFNKGESNEWNKNEEKKENSAKVILYSSLSSLPKRPTFFPNSCGDKTTVIFYFPKFYNFFQFFTKRRTEGLFDYSGTVFKKN